MANGAKKPTIETEIPKMVNIPPPTIPPIAMAISSVKPKFFLFCI